MIPTEKSEQDPAVTVLAGGDVYSSADPFATAIAFEGPIVSWVGSDEAAGTLGAPVQDLEGDFVAPAFVDAGLDLRVSAPEPQAFVAAGIAGVHAIGTAAALAAFEARAGRLAVLGYALDAQEGPAARSAAQLADGQRPPGALCVLVESEADEAALAALLNDAGAVAHAQRSGWRLRFGRRVPEALCERLGAAGIALTVDPSAEQPLAGLLAAGAQVSFALDPAAPWRSIRAAVWDRAGGISGRAAFNCATRFAHRAAGRFEAGVLAPGAAATAVRWRADRLVVQVSDDRVAAWSTDPRSGTPGLPDLGDPERLPTVREVWVDGVSAALG
ncbi:metal-dependent hydrolase [Brevibacterium sp. BRM-1]|uniref:metal-dependent hydrolase n=1 Tax=Brevibacterium sp. BRM-1 TaxID=2999062 RepID=UPI0022828331|nr:metal-dependent hydrolase [Brevibacterium sp. BRM-1]WAL40769.1 metal-dependent hydrolase [Brevibacterium sp. BRM-1]